MNQHVILVETHRAEDVLPEDKIPEIDEGKSVIVSSDPDGPFRMLVNKEDWEQMMMSVTEGNSDT